MNRPRHHSIVAAANTSWAPAFLMRTHGMSASEVGLWLGSSIGIGLILGSVITGILVDKLGSRDARWYMRIPAAAHLLTFFFAAVFLLTSDFRIAVAAFLPYMAATSTWATPAVWPTSLLRWSWWMTAMVDTPMVRRCGAFSPECRTVPAVGARTC